MALAVALILGSGTSTAGAEAGRAYLLPGLGDITGDGFEDVLLWEHSSDPAASLLRARRGTDGAVIWALTVDPHGAAILTDLDGRSKDVLIGGSTEVRLIDGIDGSVVWHSTAAGSPTVIDLGRPVKDVLVRSVQGQTGLGTSSLDEPIPSVLDAEVTRSTGPVLTVLNGTDGTARWQLSWDSVELAARACRPPLWQCPSDKLKVDDVERIEVMPDASGDGRPDIFMLTRTDAIETGWAFDGQDGTPIGSTAAAVCPASTTTAMTPVTDVSGDGLADLILQGTGPPAYPNGPLCGVRAFTFNRPVPLWSSGFRVINPSFRVVDLTGDHRPDVLFDSSTEDILGNPRWETIGLDGSNGRYLFGSASLIGRPEVIGDIDGDGGQDLGSATCWEVWARSGLDGRVLWRNERPGCYYSYYPVQGRYADLDGDGVQDVILSQPYPPDFSFTKEAFRGRDGEALWVSSQHGEVAAVVADLDGDGGDDKFAIFGRPQMTFSAWNGASLAPITSFDLAGWGPSVSPANLTSDAGGELVFEGIGEVTAYTLQGSELWSFGGSG